jgi:DnaJ-class molecular chaperone
MDYTYKICNLCDARGYDSNTKITCQKCKGKGIEIFPIIKKDDKKDDKD